MKCFGPRKTRSGNPCWVLNATACTPLVEDQAKERARAKRLWDNYKLTIAQYEIILAHQRGVCYICWCPEPVKGRRLSVDHDHDTGEIRGLACSRCNPLIGKIENAYKRYGLGKVKNLSVAIVVERIAAYLLNPPVRIALGMKHIGYTGRTGTKAHRKRLRKERKLMPPVKHLLPR